jgi:hypothetical protein
MFTGVAGNTSPTTVAISGSYFGSTVPEPSSLVLFGTAAFLALLRYRRWNRGQEHIVRGFLSILGSKGGLKVESAKKASGERTFRIA